MGDFAGYVFVIKATEGRSIYDLLLDHKQVIVEKELTNNNLTIKFESFEKDGDPDLRKNIIGGIDYAFSSDINLGYKNIVISKDEEIIVFVLKNSAGLVEYIHIVGENYECTKIKQIEESRCQHSTAKFISDYFDLPS